MWRSNLRNSARHVAFNRGDGGSVWKRWLPTVIMITMWFKCVAFFSCWTVAVWWGGFPAILFSPCDDESLQKNQAWTDFVVETCVWHQRPVSRSRQAKTGQPVFTNQPRFSRISQGLSWNRIFRFRWTAHAVSTLYCWSSFVFCSVTEYTEGHGVFAQSRNHPCLTSPDSRMPHVVHGSDSSHWARVSSFLIPFTHTHTHVHTSSVGKNTLFIKTSKNPNSK